MRKLKTLSIIILIALIASVFLVNPSPALQFEKLYRGNVLFQGIIRTSPPASGVNRGYWTNTTGQFQSNFVTKTDTAKFFNLDFDYQDDTGSETAYGFYLNFDDNATAASTVYMIAITSEGDANSTSYGLWIDPNWTVGIDCDSPVELDSLDLEPATNIDALDIIGTNITTASHIDMDILNVSGSIVTMDYTSAKTLTGDLKGFEVDLSTNVTLSDQNLIGFSLVMPGTFGAGSEHGLLITGDGQTIGICDDAVGLSIDEGTAGDAISLSVGTAGDVQAIVIDATTLDSTSTAGMIDLNWDSSTTGASGINVAMTSVDDDAADTLYGLDMGITVADDTTATDTIYGQRIDITQNDTDGTGVGLFVSANDSGAGVVSTGILISNLQATDIDLTDGILINATTSGSMPDAIDVSDSEITNAINVGDNTILGSTAVIDFTDFDVDADGKTILAPDTDGDALTINFGAAADLQAIVIDSSTNDSTSTSGIIDIGFDSATSGASGINLALTSVDDDAADTLYGLDVGITVADDTTATDTIYGQRIDITQNDTDGTGIGLLVSANDSGAGVVTAGIRVDNLQATDIDITDGIIVAATTADSIVDGIDVSDQELTNAVNVGDNIIVGSTATIDFTDFDVDSDGKTILAPDTAGDALTINFGAAADLQGLVIDASTNDSTNATGIIDLNWDSATDGASGLNIAMTSVDDDAGDTLYGISIPIVIADDTTATDSVFGQIIDITQNDTTGTGTGLYITANDSGSSVVTAGIRIDNLQASDIDMTDGIIIAAVTADSIVDGLDVSDSELTNAVNVGDNDIEGTTATITFTDFQVDSDGKITTAPDTAGDALTINFGAADDFQALVVDATTNDSTNTTGIIDLNFDSATSGASGINLALTSVDDDAADTLYGIDIPVTIQDDTTATDTVYGQRIDITQNDTDGTGIGLLVSANDNGAGVVTAGIRVDNLQATDIDMTDGIIVAATTADSIVDGIDVSDAELTNAMSVGDNIILGGAATINFTSFDVSSGGAITGLADLNLGADDDIAHAYIHDAGTLVFYDDSDDTTVTLGPVADGTTTLGITGSLSLSGGITLPTITLEPSSGDAIAVNFQAAADIQALVIDGTTNDSTNTTGIIDLNWDSATSGASGINIAMTSVDDDAADTLYGIDIPIVVADDTTATDTIYGQRIDITQNDTDGTGIGLFVSANDNGTSVVTAGIRVENLQATDIDMTDGIIVAATTADSIVDGLDVSDASLTNAVNVGANDIEGTDATITFTDFQVAAEGLMTIAPDSAGDAITLTGFAGDFQGIVIDASTADSTNISGIVDIDFDSATSGASGINLAFTSVDDDAADTLYGIDIPVVIQDDTTADDTVYGIHIDITQNDDDNPIGTGLYISNNDAGTNGELLAGILIENLQATDIDIDDGILIQATTTNSIEDAIDVSDPEIVNAINIGTNEILGTDFSVNSDGGISSAPDAAGDAIYVLLPAQATQGLVVEGSTNDSTAADGIIDLNWDSATTGASGMNIAMTSVDDDAADTLYGIDMSVTVQDDTTATDTIYGQRIDITQNDTDGTGIGLLVSANDNGAGVVTAGIRVDNLQATDIDMTDGIIVAATTADSIVDGLDVSDAELTNALNTGENLISGNLEPSGLIRSSLYHWIEEFDDEVSAVQFESGLVADFWVTGGTNYAAANVTYEEGIGGTLEADTAGADSDSVTILGAANFRVDSNPIVEFRFKVDDVTTCFAMCGLVEGSFVSKDAPDDDIYLVGLDADNGHGFGATTIVALSNNNNAGALYDNCTVTMANDTYVIIRFDLTDVNQPRVWINGTEVSAAALLDTVQAGTTLMPYIMVESLAGPATPRTLTIDYIRVWQDRG